MSNKATLLLFILSIVNSFSQIISTSPYILNVDQLKSWTTTGTTASVDLVSNINLVPRFINTQTQLNTALNNNMEIAYLPDGMNNFANYYGEQSQFNLYNFTHWAYIDKLIWFGGTASDSVQLPSSPWTNAAHKNGVKVFGNVFFAPNAFGGATATLQNFLEKDINGNFIVIPKMVSMMQYYNFDGWFINQETTTTAAVAQLMYEFLRNLTAQAEAIGKEVMWYDSMLLTGTVSWQNRLNVNNSPFLQNDQDNNLTNGFESKVSSNMFINFFWNGTTLPNGSRTRATTIGRSSFEVFTGVDIWPGRNQGQFENSGNTWMGNLHQTANTPTTSLGLFAVNCLFNNAVYSNFNNDPNDYVSFYNAERRFFSGTDNNPSIVDATSFKGLSNWIPATSVITTKPFESNFCTGHGNKKFSNGTIISQNSWHNMNNQEILPTWQFAFSSNNLTANWDFNNAYNFGNSLKIQGNLLANSPIDLMLYKTKLLVNNQTIINLAFQQNSIGTQNMKLILVFADDVTQKYEFLINANTSTDWTFNQTSLSNYSGREIAVVGLRFESATALSGYAINVGNLKIFDDATFATNKNNSNSNFINISYQQNNQILFDINWPNNEILNQKIHDTNGKLISEKKIIDLKKEKSYHLDASKFQSGVYLITFFNENNLSETKKIVVK